MHAWMIFISCVAIPCILADNDIELRKLM